MMTASEKAEHDRSRIGFMLIGWLATIIGATFVWGIGGMLLAIGIPMTVLGLLDL